MPKQNIDIGSSANDGTGDSLRVAFDKCNDNFDELYTGQEALEQDKAEKNNVLELDNTTEFTPDGDYEPATKKFVEDSIAAVRHFTAVSADTIAVPSNANLSTLNSTVHFTGFSLIDTPVGFTLRASDGAIQNSSGSEIGSLSGTISFQLDISGPGTISQLAFWSETSSDGVTFTPLPGGLRVFEVSASAESFRSTVSFTTDWLNGHWIRWKSAMVGANTVAFSASSGTSNGQALTGNSVVWELQEDI